jgi:hypothetical protein
MVESSSSDLMLECHMPHRISRCFVGLIRFVSNGPITFGQLRRTLPINLLINICGATRIVRGSFREDTYVLGTAEHCRYSVCVRPHLSLIPSDTADLSQEEAWCEEEVSCHYY